MSTNGKKHHGDHRGLLSLSAGRAPEEELLKSLSDQCCLYGARDFKRLLVMERKRTERSGRPFLLVLLDIRRLRADMELRELFQAMSHVLDTASRE
ncbi:MAG: hypothetical protein GF331_20580, partial [Chitinivibrionales bacterium]|nr:hypothetical protein [Chitinivibrionales bacterium]